WPSRSALTGKFVVELIPGTVEENNPLGPRAPGSGTGLIGMRERVSLLGGTLDAGPVSGPEGMVWRVRAALPLDDESAQSLSAQSLSAQSVP
ncbi:hypothetical protein ACWEWX_36150, partial [Streptomyces asiaticus]